MQDRGLPFIYERMKFIDSRTGGKPRRVFIEGGADLVDGNLQESLVNLRNHLDNFRSSVFNEPRGWDAMVGAYFVNLMTKLVISG